MRLLPYGVPAKIEIAEVAALLEREKRAEGGYGVTREGWRCKQPLIRPIGLSWIEKRRRTESGEIRDLREGQRGRRALASVKRSGSQADGAGRRPPTEMEMEGEMELIELLARMMDRSRVAVHVSAK